MDCGGAVPSQGCGLSGRKEPGVLGIREPIYCHLQFQHVVVVDSVVAPFGSVGQGVPERGVPVPSIPERGESIHPEINIFSLNKWGYRVSS